MSVKLKDIADKLELSVSTISRVINGKGVVSEETRRRILETAREMEYYPNEFGRGLRTMKANTIAVVLPDVTNPYFSYILRGIEEKCSLEGYSMLVGITNYDWNRSRQYVDEMAAKHVAGIIIVSNDDRGYEILQQSGITVVSLNEHKRDVRINWIAIDNYRAMFDLTQYLINQGHRHIACLYGFNDGENTTGDHRKQGFEDCMAANKIEIPPQMKIDAGLGYETGRKAAQRMLCLPQLPTAIVCHNNSIAVGAYDALRSAGYHVPTDVSIACFDAIVPKNVIAQQFTCILQPVREIAHKAVERIVRADTYKGYTNDALDYEMVIGDSTRSIK